MRPHRAAANILLSGPLTLHLSPALWFAREGGVFVALSASVLSLLAIALERLLTMERRGPAPAAHLLLKTSLWTIIAVSIHFLENESEEKGTEGILY